MTTKAVSLLRHRVYAAMLETLNQIQYFPQAPTKNVPAV
jgi:hypothetical protein